MMTELTTSTSLPRRSTAAPRRLVARRDFVIEQVGGDLLLLDEKTSQIHSLDEAGALLWQLCDGSRSVEQIIEAFESQDQEIARDEIQRALVQFEIAGLVEHR